MKKIYDSPNMVVALIEKNDILTSSKGLTLSTNQNGNCDGANFEDLFK